MTALPPFITGGLHTIAGLELISSELCIDRKWRQFRFPRSKKTRIRRKWAKRNENWKWIVTPRAYRIGNRLIAHPVIVRKLHEQFARNGYARLPKEGNRK